MEDLLFHFVKASEDETRAVRLAGNKVNLPLLQRSKDPRNYILKRHPKGGGEKHRMACTPPAPLTRPNVGTDLGLAHEAPRPAPDRMHPRHRHWKLTTNP